MSLCLIFREDKCKTAREIVQHIYQPTASRKGGAEWIIFFEKRGLFEWFRNR